MRDVIQCLRELRQSSESSVVTGIEKVANRDRPTVEHPIEPWLIDLILDQLTNPNGAEFSLIVLSGNSGDGKSYLLREIRERLSSESGLDPAKVSWLLDATESEHKAQKAVDRLRDFFAAFADGRSWSKAGLHVVAMNTGTVVRFIANDRPKQRFSQLSDVFSLQLAIRAVPEEDPVSPDFWDNFDRVLAIDLDRRLLFPLEEDKDSFLSQMLSKLSRSDATGFLARAATDCSTCSFASQCAVNANLTALESERVRRRLNRLLLDVTLEDRIHLGPRSLWHLVYQMTVGGLDAQALRAHRRLPTCADIGSLTADERAYSLFFMSLFEDSQNYIGAGRAALSAELSRIDPARHFALAAHEAALAASLSVEEDLRLAKPHENELHLPAGLFAGPPSSTTARARSAVRRAFFLAPDDPDPVRHAWLGNWTESLRRHRNEIISGGASRHDSVNLLIRVLVELYRSANRDGLWRLDLPWRSRAQLYSLLTLRPGQKKTQDDPRVTGPDSYRPRGIRTIAKGLAEQLGSYPLSITVPLKDGPDVRVTWPLYRLLQRVSDQAYAAGSLDPERVQNLERIGASLGAQAAIEAGVAVLTSGHDVLCQDDGEGGYDVVEL